MSAAEAPKQTENTAKRPRAVVRNTCRARVFRQFVLRTFGPDLQRHDDSEAEAGKCSGDGAGGHQCDDVVVPPELRCSGHLRSILDVAGGKGELGIPFAVAGYNVAIVDPRMLDLAGSKTYKNLQFHLEQQNTKTFEMLKRTVPASILDAKAVPLPGQFVEFFTSSVSPALSVAPPTSGPETIADAKAGTDAEHAMGCSEQSRGPSPVVQGTHVCGSSSSGSGKTETDEERVRRLATIPESSALQAAKLGATLLLGMHSDQATEPIVDFALKTQKAFAVVPCCVFPGENPHRKTPKGTVVRSYEQFVEYLLAKHPALHTATLDFDGRNQVVYGIPPYAAEP